MYRLLLLAFFGLCHGALLSAPCTLEEMKHPMESFNLQVKGLESPHTDREKLLEHLETELKFIVFNYTQEIAHNCGEEKVEVLKEYEEYINFPKALYGVLNIFEYHNATESKLVFKTMESKPLIHYIIQYLEFTYGYLSKIIDVAREVEILKVKSYMYTAIIHTFNTTTITQGKLIIPDLKELTNNAGKDTALEAKLNLKLLVHKSSMYYPDALEALNEIDKEFAEQAIKETIRKIFKIHIHNKAFDVVSKAPTSYLKAVALKTMQDIVISDVTDYKNDLVYNKIHSLAEYYKNGDTDGDSKATEIFNEILAN